MKKLFIVLLSVLAAALLFTICGTKTLHCDNCGKEISISSGSKMDESWILYCKDCEKTLGLDKVE